MEVKRLVIKKWETITKGYGMIEFFKSLSTGNFFEQTSESEAFKISKGEQIMNNGKESAPDFDDPLLSKQSKKETKESAPEIGDFENPLEIPKKQRMGNNSKEGSVDSGVVY